MGEGDEREGEEQEGQDLDHEDEDEDLDDEDDDEIEGDEEEKPQDLALTGPIRPIATLGIAVTAFLSLHVVARMVDIWASVLNLRLIDEIESGAYVSDAAIVANQARLDLIFASRMGLLVVTAIVFLIWMHRVYANLSSLDYRPKQTPGWAVSSWFFPVLNIVRPFNAMKEIYAASDPERKVGEPVAEDAPGLMVAWWMTWLIGGIIGQVVFRIPAENNAQIAHLTWASMLVAGIWAACAILAALLVDRTTKRQAALIARLAGTGTPRTF